MAEMVCGPAVSVAMDWLVAVPSSRSIGGPKLAPSMTNCTLPVRVPAPAESVPTFALKTRGSPYVGDCMSDRRDVCVGMSETLKDPSTALRLTSSVDGTPADHVPAIWIAELNVPFGETLATASV